MPPRFPTKACPVVFRALPAGRAVLAFDHPLAGCQLVKGTIEPGETAREAAVRELREEAGLVADPGRSLDLWLSGHDDQVWALVDCVPRAPPGDTWVHRAPDDGGHDFRFFWQPLAADPAPADWHPVFRRALAHLRRRG